MAPWGNHAGEMAIENQTVSVIFPYLHLGIQHKPGRNHPGDSRQRQPLHDADAMVRIKADLLLSQIPRHRCEPVPETLRMQVAPVSRFLSSMSLRLGLLGGLVTANLDALQDVLTVLVDLQGGDDGVGGVDAEGNALGVGLVAGDALDVDDAVLVSLDTQEMQLRINSR